MEEPLLAGLPKLKLGELRKYCGRGGEPIYVSIKGVVYDVSESAHLYGPGECSSHPFIAKQRGFLEVFDIW